MASLTKKLANKILAKYNTAEKATALKGAERAEYLKALDKVHGPAKERAKKMGFDEDTFHGTPVLKPIEKFKESGLSAKYGKGVYATKNPEKARIFAGPRGVIYPLKVKNLDIFNPDDLNAALDILKREGIEVKPRDLQKLRSTEEGLHILEKKLGKKNISNVLDKYKKRAGDFSEDMRENLTSNKPKNVRSTNAAFDPRFEDSDLIMALGEKASKGGGKVLDTLALPQRILFNRAAQAMGLRGGDTSEESAFQMVDALSNKVGLPQDNTAINALKGAAVGALDTFVDFPILGAAGKVAKVANRAKKAIPARLLKKIKQKANTKNLIQPDKIKVADRVEDISPNLRTASKVDDTYVGEQIKQSVVDSLESKKYLKSIGVPTATSVKPDLSGGLENLNRNILESPLNKLK